MSKNNLIAALKAHYAQSASLTAPLGAKTICRQFAGGAWAIASSYIRLAILLSSEEGDKTRLNEQQADEKSNNRHNLDPSLALARYEDIQAVKMPLELDQLFNSIPNAKDRIEHQIRRKVWILGRAGVGKTTLTQRLAYEWANPEDTDWKNQPQLFKSALVTETSSASEPMVIWIKLRELADYLDKLDLGKAKLVDDEAGDGSLLVHEALALFIRQKILLAHQRNRFTREALSQLISPEES
ncbi:MAG: NACHT domain-containing protein, partial [Gammaproteobacteria bacterium]